jgi:hypothetical protein
VLDEEVSAHAIIRYLQIEICTQSLIPSYDFHRALVSSSNRAPVGWWSRWRLCVAWSRCAACSWPAQQWKWLALWQCTVVECTAFCSPVLRKDWGHARHTAGRIVPRRQWSWWRHTAARGSWSRIRCCWDYSYFLFSLPIMWHFCAFWRNRAFESSRFRRRRDTSSSISTPVIIEVHEYWSKSRETSVSPAFSTFQ